MHVEVANVGRGTNEAVTSLREETIKRQDAALISMISQRGNINALANS